MFTGESRGLSEMRCRLCDPGNRHFGKLSALGGVAVPAEHVHKAGSPVTEIRATTGRRQRRWRCSCLGERGELGKAAAAGLAGSKTTTLESSHLHF